MTYATIYGLTDPDTGRVMYIGKANDAEQRFKGHLRDAARRKTPVYQWINSLHKKPQMIVLASCITKDWQTVEKQIIAQYRQDGELLNVADGGNEPKSNSQVNRANGKKLNQRLRSDPRLKRIRELKRAASDFIRRAKKGEVRQEVVDRCFAKLRLAAEKNPILFGEYRHI